MGNYEAAGWPRGTCSPGFRWTNDRLERLGLPLRLPMPWINGNREGDFHSFRDEALAAARGRCCVVCGLAIQGPVFFAAMDGEKATSGMGGHARCILLAVTRCPHVVENARLGKPVAWRYDGAGVGVRLPDEDDGLEWGDNDRIDDSCVQVSVDDLKRACRAEQSGVCRG